jgi:hypothetical protein
LVQANLRSLTLAGHLKIETIGYTAGIWSAQPADGKLAEKRTIMEHTASLSQSITDLVIAATNPANKPSATCVSHSDPKIRLTFDETGDLFGWVRVDASMIETLEQWAQVQEGQQYERNNGAVAYIVKDALEHYCANVLSRHQARKEQKAAETRHRQLQRQLEAAADLQFLADMKITF